MRNKKFEGLPGDTLLRVVKIEIATGNTVDETVMEYSKWMKARKKNQTHYFKAFQKNH